MSAAPWATHFGAMQHPRLPAHQSKCYRNRPTGSSGHERARQDRHRRIELAGLKGGLKMVSQQAMRFYQRIGYHPYEGITEDFGERDGILQELFVQRRGGVCY